METIVHFYTKKGEEHNQQLKELKEKDGVDFFITSCSSITLTNTKNVTDSRVYLGSSGSSVSLVSYFRRWSIEFNTDFYLVAPAILELLLVLHSHTTLSHCNRRGGLSYHH